MTPALTKVTVLKISTIWELNCLILPPESEKLIIIFKPSEIGSVIKSIIKSISELLVLSSKNEEICVSEIEFPY